MTSTLYFYKLPVNFANKNFILESLSSYLLNFTPVTKTNFQYQRFDMQKTIKVNWSQDYQLNISSLTKYNYLKITTLTSDNKTATYYYFIKAVRQISEETIEFTIEMDVLNTFSFSPSAAPNTYTLNKKSLITREHKDRLKTLTSKTLYKDEPMNAATLEAINLFKSPSIPLGSVGGTFYFNFEEMISGEIPIFTWPVAIFRNDFLMSFYLYSSDGRLLQSTLAYRLDIYRDFIRVYTNSLDSVDYPYVSMRGQKIGISILANTSMVTPMSYTSDPATKNYFLQFINTEVYPKSYTIARVEKLVDEFEEGISTTLFKKNEQTLYDEDGKNQWYVVYTSSIAVVDDPNATSSKYVNPVLIEFYSDSGYELITSSANLVTIFAYDSRIPKWENDEEILGNPDDDPPSALGEQYFIINGVTYDLYDYEFVNIYRQGNNDTSFNKAIIKNRTTGLVTIVSTPFSFFQVYGLNQLSVTGLRWNETTLITINSGKGGYYGTSDPWRDKDLTDPKIIKAFAFPYGPVDFLVGQNIFEKVDNPYSFNTDNNSINLLYPQKAIFSYQKVLNYESPLGVLQLSNITPAKQVTRNIMYESKMLHSDFYLPKFVYDSFSYSFILENIDGDYFLDNFSPDEFVFTFSCTKNVLSKFMFTFDECAYKRSTQDYDKVLLIDRNNEKALYSNAYINYIKSGGFNYDAKKANSQNAVNGLTTALSLIGGVASFAGGIAAQKPMLAYAGVTLMATSLASLTRTIHQVQENDRAISQKILQAQQQGTSVQGSEDIDLLTIMCNNKPKLTYYEVSDRMKQAVWDLFHYCGYATHEQKIPSVNTRLYFNFVQGEIILKDYTFNEEIAREIVNKWKEGVTFMHYVDGGYDLDQQYENFETSIM